VFHWNLATQKVHPKRPPEMAFEENVCPVFVASNKIRGEIFPKFMGLRKGFEDNNTIIVLEIFQ